jgi:putative transposase
LIAPALLSAKHSQNRAFCVLTSSLKNASLGRRFNSANGETKGSNKGEAKSVLSRRDKYTWEFKLEFVRWVKGGQDITATSTVLGTPHQTQWRWVKLSDKGHLKRAFRAEVNGESGGLRRLREFRASDIRLGKARVQLTIKLHRLRAKGKKKFVVATNSEPALPIAKDLLNREFTLAQPNTACNSDLFYPTSYIPTDEGWLYLVAVIDLLSRELQKGSLFHSDQGSRYCSREFQAALKAYGMRSSMSRKGDCWDNAPTESLWGRLKVARAHGHKFATRGQAMDAALNAAMDW